MDGAVLVNEWGGELSTTNPKIDFVLTPSANQGTVLAGKTASFTLSVTESGDGQNKVSLTATATAGLTGSISPAIDPARHNCYRDCERLLRHATGAKNIVVTGTDSTGTQTVTYTLTVTPLPTLTLNTASTSVTVMRGTSSNVGVHRGYRWVLHRQHPLFGQLGCRQASRRNGRPIQRRRLQA